MTPTTDLYFEAHVTISPVFGLDLIAVHELARKYKFRIADLLMQKRKEDSPERSKYDTFCTGHSLSYDDLLDRSKGLVGELQNKGYQVWRYKIENTLLDVKLNETKIS